MEPIQRRDLLDPKRLAGLLGMAAALLFLLAIAPAARADEIAYACNFDICTINPDHTETHADLTKTENDEFQPAWSPDGTRIAFNGDYTKGASIYTISAADPEAGATEVIDGTEPTGGEPAWSPDGSRIAFAGTNPPSYNDVNVYVSPANGTSAPQLVGYSPAEEKEPAWSPDGTLLAFARGTSTWISAPEAGATAHELANGAGMEPAWSPDGTKIATVTAYEPHLVRLIDADGDGHAETMPIAAENTSDVAWSPDGTHVAYIDANDKVRIAPTDPPGEGFEITMPPQVGVPLTVSFSPEGDRIAFSAEELQSSRRQIYLAPASGGEAQRLTDGTSNAQEPVWKPIPGASGGGAGGTGGGSSGGGAGATGGSSSGAGGSGASPSPTRAPVVLQLAAFRHPLISTEGLGAAYVPCNLGPSTNAACHASGEATYVAPITNSLDLARTKGKAKPIVFAKGSVTVPNGKTKPLPLKITAAGKKLLKPGRSLKLTVSVVETAPGAKPRTTAKTLTVKVPKEH